MESHEPHTENTIRTRLFKPDAQEEPRALQEQSTNVIVEAWHYLTDFNKRFLHTLTALVRKPTTVIEAFCVGERTYYNPYSFLFTIATIVTAVSLLIHDEADWFNIFDQMMQQQDANQNLAIAPNDSAEAKNVKLYMQDMMHNYLVLVVNIMVRYSSLYYLILYVPCMAFSIYLFFRKRRQYFRSYFIASLYITALYTILSAFSTPVFFMYPEHFMSVSMISLFSYVLISGYCLPKFLHFKGVFDWFKLLFSFVFFSTLMYILMLVLFMGSAAVLTMNGVKL